VGEIVGSVGENKRKTAYRIVLANARKSLTASSLVIISSSLQNASVLTLSHQPNHHLLRFLRAKNATDILTPVSWRLWHILRGNLAPDGAVFKQTAASPHLLQHRGPAYVFEDIEQMRAEINREDLPVTKDTVLAMKNCGLKGGPGFPEWGQIPMPRVLLNQGIDDIVRVSDARLSGTSFGTVVLHAAAESAIGGPLPAVRTGDQIELDVANRPIELCIGEEELQRRLTAFRPREPKYSRGYGRMFLEHVTQANEGCDFDFLRPE
jgi:dihydroxyacid dehydratase/phosphogluconate dehydratase